MKRDIFPCLWFDNVAKEAADFYCSAFGNANITSENPIVVELEIFGQKFTCLNGGTKFQCNPSISFFVIFETAKELEETWDKLSKGGNVLMPLDKYDWSEKYGWIQDKYGVSWQLSFGKISEVGQAVTPCLMLTGDKYGLAKEVLAHYTGIFKNSEIDGILHYSKADAPDREDAIKHAQFSLDNNKFMIMESIHEHPFTFNEAISLIVMCDNQEEIDYFWEKLGEGGYYDMCGWLKDKYGVSWQIVPKVLTHLLSDPDKSERVVQTFLKMKKFDIAVLMNS